MRHNSARQWASETEMGIVVGDRLGFDTCLYSSQLYDLGQIASPLGVSGTTVTWDLRPCPLERSVALVTTQPSAFSTERCTQQVLNIKMPGKAWSYVILSNLYHKLLRRECSLHLILQIRQPCGLLANGFPVFLTVRKQDLFGCSSFHIQESWPPLLPQDIKPD